MDLGSIITDLGTSYIQARYAQPAVTSQPVAYTAPVGVTPADFDIPFVDVVPQGACKKRRRRRKRLATQSDLKDLAALKGILGQGKAFEVWIATHS